VGNKTRKDNQGKPLAIKDAHGRTWFQWIQPREVPST
jgi:hypothetical protein